ncbi:hypothetical protein [Paenibacillus contaminans]|uniref:Uncharacterized protein n=1 Tax=Paenibacillus contaminans TaxID=450362 RepID=A0A329MD02_9BACL|nr:hypothetical protein [Paenibacillus contaminans]RAV17824.1 hypothetical protein DQG23_25775 [Paenibacillus contaminans]
MTDQNIQWVFSGIGATAIAIGIPIITAAISFMLKNLRFFMSEEEKLHTNGTTRAFRILTLSIFSVLFTGLYFCILTNNDIQSFSLFPYIEIFFKSSISLPFGVSIFIVVLIVAFVPRIKNRIAIIDERSSSKNQSLLTSLFLLMVLYILFFSLAFGYFINAILSDANLRFSINQENSLLVLLQLSKIPISYKFILFSLSLIYLMLFLPLRKFWYFLSHSKVQVNILLMDGTLYSSKYLLNSDLDNCILIGDSDNLFTPDKILIPKNNIKQTSFNSVHYRFGRRIPISTNITLPEQFNSDEKRILKAIKENNRVFLLSKK